MSTAPLSIAAPGLFVRGRRGACLGAVALVSLIAFEATAVAAAMPAIAAALDGIALYALAFGGMLATSVLGMVAAGASCDRHGPRRATAAGLAIFAAGLLLAGFAGTMPLLVAGRIVQGLGAGMLGVALYVGMGQLVPQALHPRLFALMAGAWVLPSLVGPLAAAWLVQQLGWRAVFLVVAALVPLAAAWLLPAFEHLHAPAGGDGKAAPRRARLRWAALAAVGALLLHGADQAAAIRLALPALALGLVAAGLAARRLLPGGSLVAAPGLPAVIALRGLLAAAFASAEAFLPLYLTREAGWTLAHAGLTLSAGAVLWSCGSAVQARIAGDRARQRGLQAGLLAVAAGTALIATQVVASHAAWIIVAGWAMAGFGVGLGFPILSVRMLSLSAPGAQGRNASALQLSDALFSSAVLALAGALFNGSGGSGPTGFLLVLGLGFALAIGAAALGRRAFG